MSRALRALASLAALGCVTGTAAAATPQVLVRFAPGTPAADRADALAGGDVNVARRMLLRGGYVVDVERGQTQAQAIAALEGSDDILWAEPNATYTASVQPTDPLFARQWSLTNTGQPLEGVTGLAGADIGAATAWDTTTGSPTVSVGIVDTGIALDQPDLVPNLRPGYDFVSRDEIASDLDGHGTFVAGIVGARGGDGVGVAGVAWSAGLVPLRALDAEGRGTAADVADAFRDAGRRGLPIVNASLGGPNFSQAIADSIAASPRTLFVVAAGNEARDVDLQPSYPCSLPAENVVCVAASDQADALAPFSNVGVRGVDLAAPGVNVLGPQPAIGAPVVADDFEREIATTWSLEPSTGWLQTKSARFSGLASIGVQGNGPAGVVSEDIARLVAPIDLTGRMGCRVSMRLRVDAGSGAAVALDASRDGASWTELSRTQSSTQGRFVLQNAYLGALDGAASVQLRLRYLARGLGGAAFVDDLQVACLGGTYGDDDYAVESGTSFASPHVAGVAALVASRYPWFGPADIRRALLEGVTPIASLSGRVASGGRLSAPGSLTVAARIAEGYRPGATTGVARTATGGIQLEGIAQTRGLAGTVRFEWGPSTAYGSTTAEKPLAGLATDQAASDIVGLAARQTYHYRLVVSTVAGVSVGADQTITTGAIAALPTKFGIQRPVKLRGVWRVTITLPRTALTEIILQRRTTVGKPVWKKVRVVGPRDRPAGLLNVRLGRLTPGRYRVVARFPEARVARSIQFTVPARKNPR